VALADDVDGYGPVSRLMRDENVTDVLTTTTKCSM